MSGLTTKQIQKRHFVDGAIHRMLETVIGDDLVWDDRMIGRVREVVSEVVCEKTGMTPAEFYPEVQENVSDEEIPVAVPDWLGD